MQLCALSGWRNIDLTYVFLSATVLCFNYVAMIINACVLGNKWYTQEEEKEEEATKEDLALKEMTEPTSREEEELKKSKEHEKKENLCDISQALAVLASASVRPYLFSC